MANSKSAAKRARQNASRALRNINVRTRVKTVVRHFHEAVADGDASAIEQAMNVATREIRRAVAKGTMHKATASRRVSRLVLAFNKTK